MHRACGPSLCGSLKYVCFLSSRNSGIFSCAISQITTGWFSNPFTSPCGTLKVHPNLSDQVKGWPFQASLRSSGEIRVRTVRLISPELVGKRSLYHLGVPGYFCLAAGRGGSPFFFPLTILTSWPDQSSCRNQGSFIYMSGLSLIFKASSHSSTSFCWTPLTRS